jgi:hypothetical protein
MRELLKLFDKHTKDLPAFARTRARAALQEKSAQHLLPKHGRAN